MEGCLDVYRSHDNRAEPEYDEYDAGDDDDRSNKMSSSKVPNRPKPNSSSAATRPSEPLKANKPPVVQDLFDFGDEAEQIQTPMTLPRSTAPEPMASTLDDGKTSCRPKHVHSLKDLITEQTTSPTSRERQCHLPSRSSPHSVRPLLQTCSRFSTAPSPRATIRRFPHLRCQQIPRCPRVWLPPPRAHRLRPDLPVGALMICGQPVWPV